MLNNHNTFYSYAAEQYKKIGVDPEEALRRLAGIAVSVHCWQGDDVRGFEGSDTLTGGITATGNYPGRARNAAELMADFDAAMRLVPGKKRLNLHASYAITEQPVERDALLPEHFAPWVTFAKERGYGLDFNPTFFSHPKSADNLTLSHPDDEIRNFWIRHGKACRRIAASFGEALGSPSLCNIWIPDGYKNTPADRLSPRLRLKASLDEIFADRYDPRYIIDSVESKVFGLGLEAYTVGSSEFYLNYAARKEGVYNLLDNGHYHPDEKVSDKISAMLAFCDRLPLHVTRPLHWDSDHVVLLEDELLAIAGEIIAAKAEDKAIIGLDYFDASINRVAAWVIGTRNMQKALLHALLTPYDELSRMQEAGDFTGILAAGEDQKTLPFGEIWAEYCRRQGVPTDGEWYKAVQEYEETVLKKRV